jgi:uncharacterized protein (DUF2236 family)
MSGLSLALGGANVIMQLARPGVGSGVVESTVESGSLHQHPIKRTRTTLGYIVIALYGTDQERLVMRREVDRQHRSVRSSDDSPVVYSAFDPELQLWVAACMYRGLEDAVNLLHRSIAASTLEGLYLRSSRFATTLQVPSSMWPTDRAAFERYWDESRRRFAGSSDRPIDSSRPDSYRSSFATSSGWCGVPVASDCSTCSVASSSWSTA